MHKFILLVLACLPACVNGQTKDTAIKELKEVSIVSKKKPVEFKDGKVIYNVSNSVNAMGSNALELLKRSPGVMVDPTNNISLNGKSGVTVYIDGKPTYMQGDALAALLKSLQSANIHSVEMLPHPSGKYDAAGSGGIINIRLKKNTASGFNGDIAAGMHFGQTPKTEGALNLNYRTGRFNLYGNYNHYFGYHNMEYDFYRVQQGQIIDNRTRDVDMRNPVNFKLGADYNISSRHTVGVMMNANLYFGPGMTNTSTYLSDAAGGQLTSMLKATNDYYSQKQNWKNYNVNYQYKDTAGRLFTTDLDYGYYRARIKNILYNHFLEADSVTETDQYTLRTFNNSDINIYGIKADYEQPVPRGKLYTGIKANTVVSDNWVQIFDVKDKTDYQNEQKSNSFRYDEKVYAAYALADQQWGNWKLQAGLRVEQTVADGALHAKSTATAKDTVQQVSNRYLDFFPSMQLSFRPSELHHFSLQYNRKIDRPTYTDLNPFSYQLDELSSWQGNAFLRPQYSNSVSVAYNATGILSASLTYTRRRDMFVSVSDSIDGNKMVMTPKNVGSQHLLALNLSSTVSPLPWWNIVANVNAFYKQNQLTFDERRRADLSINTVQLNVQQVFDVDKKTQAEVSGNYQSPDLYGGFQRSKHNWQVNIGVQRKVLKEQGIVRIGINDLFQTARWYGIRDFDGLYYRNKGYDDSRQLRLGFSYRFGNVKLARVRERSSGLETESRRVK